MAKRVVETPEEQPPEQVRQAVVVRSGGAAAQDNVRNAGLIIRREYRSRVTQRSFIISTIVLLALIVIGAFIPTIVMLISRATSGQAQAQSVGQLQLAGFVNPAGLEPKGMNLFAETAASGTPNAGAPGANGLGSLQQGYVETSNVNVVEELVSMIQTQRAYELNSKAIQTSDQMLQRLGQL